eukprot:g3637.t1
MQWLMDLVNARDAPREIREDEPDAVPEQLEEEEDCEEDLGPVSGDSSDDKATLEFGTLRKGGEKSLLGFCEVRQRGTIEACEWKVASLRPKQKSPAFKIRF